ncbi:MAG: TlpA disulfide reductase family protein [Vicinamibacterales bacterium]
MIGRRCLVLGVLATAMLTVALAGAALRPFARGSWKSITQEHQGRPLIVHFWGVTCAPCMSELPKWGQIQKSGPGVDIVFVAADPEPIDPANIDAAVARTGIGAGENWIFSDRFLERLRFEVSPRWGGELPYTVMIDRDGRRQNTSGVMDQAVLQSWIRQQASAPAAK